MQHQNGWLQIEIWQVEKHQETKLILYVLLLQAAAGGYDPLKCKIPCGNTD